MQTNTNSLGIDSAAVIFTCPFVEQLTAVFLKKIKMVEKISLHFLFMRQLKEIQTQAMALFRPGINTPPPDPIPSGQLSVR